MRGRKPAQLGIAALAIALVLSGCATGMKGSARRICYDSGLQPGTQAFTDCWQQRAQNDWNNASGAMIVGAATGAIVSGNVVAPPTYAVPSRPSIWSTPQPLVREWNAQSADHMCQYADGTVLNVGSRSCPASVAGR